MHKSIARESISAINFYRWLSTISPESKPTTDLDAGTFIANEARNGGSWISYRSTGRDSGEWYVWDGAIHRKVEEDVSELLAHHFLTQYASALSDAPRVMKKIKTAQGEREVDIHAEHRKKVRNGWRTNSGFNGLKARIRAELTVPMGYFDREKRYVVMSDGHVIDTAHLGLDKNGKLTAAILEPDPRRAVISRLGTSIHFDSVVPPVKFLSEVEYLFPDPDERGFIQIAAGAAFLGRGDAKVILVFVGPISSGKTWLLNLLSWCFGDYHGSLTSNALVAKHGGGTNWGQVDAKGKRLVTLSEPSTQQTDDSFLKSISGSRDPIRTERKFQDSEEWHAECVPMIGTNGMLKFNTKDPAIVERVCPIEMVRGTLPPSRMIDNYEEEVFDQESDGILAWILEGAVMYAEQGISIPDSIKARQHDNVVRASSPLRWLQERVSDGKYVLDPAVPAVQFVIRAEAYDDYDSWCVDNGEKPVKKLQWREEVHQYTGKPHSQKECRSNGRDRLFGVKPALVLPSRAETNGKTTLEDMGL